MIKYLLERCFRQQDRRIEILEKENIALAEKITELQKNLDAYRKAVSDINVDDQDQKWKDQEQKWNDQEKVNKMILQMLVKKDG